MTTTTDFGHIQVIQDGAQTERLRQLHAAYTDAKAAADQATAALKTITDGIKSELAQACPGANSMVLPGSGDAPALRLSRVESWRLDSTRLKKDHLETWVKYAKKSESWTLRVVRLGDDDR